MKISHIEKVSHDSFIYTFTYEPSDVRLGMGVAAHFKIRLPNGNSHSYTPCSPDTVKGSVKTLIKIYYPEGDFPGGKVTYPLS